MEYTDEALRKWGADQLLYASTISDHDERSSLAGMLTECCYELETKLFEPSPELTQQQDKFLEEILAKHGMENTGSLAPVEYSSQAYRETHPDIMGLVTKIIDLRTQAEALQKRQGSAQMS